ncbi:hypothetical protein I2486_05345 [Cellulophaga sp. E16_2]|nr:hypothetical protein [Cellulophaga sp. E16_2]
MLSTIAISLAISCKDTDKKEIPSQMDQVMAVHDEVMPKMSTIGRLISKIDEEMQATDSTEVLLKAQADLKTANSAMMAWMKGFGNRFESDEIMKGKALSKEKQRFLNEEEKKVIALRDQMNSSIENAEALLK